MTSTLEAPAVTTDAQADDITYRLTISHGSFGAPEPLKLTGPAGLAIGDEVNALVRLRVVGTSEREPISSYDTHTVTTDAKIVQFLEIDGAPIRTEAPAVAEKAERARRDRRLDWTTRGFITLCILALALSVGGALASCSAQPQTLPGVTAPASPGVAPALAAQTTCRDTARRVFTAVAQDRMTTEQGQTEVDKACADVAATDRKAILDAERTKALAAWADSPTAG